MALIVADRVQETSTTTGTGNIALAGAVTGFRTFTSVLVTGDTTYYTIADQAGVNWEVGIGTFTSPSTLARTTVLSSSNAGSLVTFTAGTKSVFITYPAGRSITADAAGTVPPSTGGTGLTSPGTSGNVLTSNGTIWTSATPAVTSYTRTSFTATAGQATFTLTYTVGSVQVFVNGALLSAGDYTASNGTSVVLASACLVGDVVEFIAISGGNINVVPPPLVTTFTSSGTCLLYTSDAADE